LKTTSFRRWAEHLAGHALAPALDREVERWTALLSRPAAPVPVDLPGAREGQLDSGAQTVAVSLEPEVTAGLLQQVPAVYHARIDEVLLTALALALAGWTRQRAFLVELEGHGRETELFEGVDLSRTVGWFTTLYPVRLELGRDASPGRALRTIKEQVRAVPGRGIGFGLLRHLRGGDAAARLLALPRPEISFNYLGQFERTLAEDGLFRPGGDAAGRTRSPLWRRRHLLEVNGLLAGGRLHFQWRYSAALHRRATIERLAEGFLAVLGSILDSCRQPEVEGRTISDFPLIQGNQEQLDRLMRKFGGPGEKRGTS
jgi:non-ribosomal peptide synthase protein (TIGR01720 family)